MTEITFSDQPQEDICLVDVTVSDIDAHGRPVELTNWAWTAICRAGLAPFVEKATGHTLIADHNQRQCVEFLARPGVRSDSLRQAVTADLRVSELVYS